jgi:hypothetical protein
MQKPPKVVAYAIVATTVQLHDDICLQVQILGLNKDIGIQKIGHYSTPNV